MLSLRERITDFLAQKRIAVVGVSRNPRDFSRQLFQELTDRGYETIPVNPNAAEVAGKICYPRVQDIPEGVDGALVMTSSARSEEVVNDCVDAGVDRIWLYRAAGTGAVSDAAVRECEDHGVEVIPGECPYMFLADAGFPHNVHGWMKTTFTSKYK